MVRSRNYIATPPGATIKEQLKDRGMTQKEFAVRMDMSEKHISKLINGDVQLTPDCAIRLEMVLGVPAKFWNSIEAIYREKLIRVETENKLEQDEEIARRLPYSEMSKSGWVPSTRNTKERVVNLRKFFGVVELSLLENEQITRIAYRRLAIADRSDLVLIAWMQRAREIARGTYVEPINIKELINRMAEIRAMTLLPPEQACQQLAMLLAGCGVSLVFLPNLKGLLLHGATFIDGNRIVLGLTTRVIDMDGFWVFLFHELGHIVLGHTGNVGGISEQDEMDADEWSRNNLIPAHDYTVFRDKHNFTVESVTEFSKAMHIAPAIVAGRLKDEGLIRHDMFDDLKGHYAMTMVKSNEER